VRLRRSDVPRRNDPARLSLCVPDRPRQAVQMNPVEETGIRKPTCPRDSPKPSPPSSRPPRRRSVLHPSTLPRMPAPALRPPHEILFASPAIVNAGTGARPVAMLSTGQARLQGRGGTCVYQMPFHPPPNRSASTWPTASPATLGRRSRITGCHRCSWVKSCVGPISSSPPCTSRTRAHRSGQLINGAQPPC